MNVVVFQTGARHNYAIVKFLYKAGYLRRFYTDFALSGDSCATRFLKLAVAKRIRSSLDRRTITGIPRKLIVNALTGSLSHAIGSRSANAAFLRQPFGGPWKLRKADIAATDIAYTQYGTGAPCLEILSAYGTKIVSDVISTPITHHISDAEREKYPEWGETPFSEDEKRFFDTVSHDMIRRSAALFCPSEKVIEDVCEFDSAAVGKCYLVPYASGLCFTGQLDPIPKQVLFAGAVVLSKGVQYLAEAARYIWQIDRDVRFVLAGTVSAAARKQIAGPNVQCIGHVSKQRMTAEFLSADILAFPSLAEGRAGAVLEAMTAGLPVVTTRASGVKIIHGKSGYCVPERDGHAPAEAILKIVNDRTLRDAMSLAAREQAQSYDLEAWSAHFLAALRAVHELP